MISNMQAYSPETDNWNIEEDFDLNAAFLGAIDDIANNSFLEMESKIQRMELVIQNALDPIMAEMIDFMQILSRAETFCNHNHITSSYISSFSPSYNILEQLNTEDPHNDCPDSVFCEDEDDDEDDEETYPRNKSAKKRRQQ